MKRVQIVWLCQTGSSSACAAASAVQPYPIWEGVQRVIRLPFWLVQDALFLDRRTVTLVVHAGLCYTALG